MGGAELLNLEDLVFLPECIQSKTNKIMTQDKKVTFIFKVVI